MGSQRLAGAARRVGLLLASRHGLLLHARGPRLRRCLTTLPEEASMGETPHRLAKEASLPSFWGLSPATINSVAALSVPMPGKETSSGAASATSLPRGAPPTRRSLPRGPRSGGPPTGAPTWSPLARHEGHLRGESGRPPRRAPSWRARAKGGAVARAPLDARGPQLVGCLRPGLDRGATGRAQGPDHLHAPVCALGHARRFSGQHRPRGGFGV